jgi:predicted acetyltransferase
MFELVDPHPRYQKSFLAAADEFVAAGEDRYAGIFGWPADETFEGRHYTREQLDSPRLFAEYCRVLCDDRLPDSPRPASYVPATTLWIADGEEYLGRISVRHRLTEPLLTWGGHIGYAVRPSARRRGHATRALALMLPVCAGLGIDPVLVTCDVDNVASRRTIEKNGGVYEDTRVGKLRYWVPVPGAHHADPGAA